MTDMISSLADQIVALINASPRSPSKAELEAVIYPPIRQALDAYHYQGKPLFDHHAEVKRRPMILQSEKLAALLRDNPNPQPGEWVQVPIGDALRDYSQHVVQPSADPFAGIFDDIFPAPTGGEEASVEIRPASWVAEAEHYHLEAEKIKRQRDAADKAAARIMNEGPWPAPALCAHYTNGHHHVPNCTKDGTMFYRCACGDTRP